MPRFKACWDGTNVPIFAAGGVGADPTVESPAYFDAGSVSRRWAGVRFWSWCYGLEFSVRVHRSQGTVRATVVGFVAVGARLKR